jgi:sugar phosphate isomerase/epimerase
MRQSMVSWRCCRALLMVGWLVVAAAAWGVASSALAAEAPWPFFAFDNGVGRGQWTPSEQAATLKELGYDGIGYWHTNHAELRERLDAFRQAERKIFALGVPARLDRPLGYEPDLDETVRLLQDSDTILYLTFGCRYTARDEKLALLVRKVAELAQPAGLRVVVFPRFGTCVGTTEHAVRIAKLADRENAGAAFSLSNELRAGNANCLPDIIKAAMPQLMLAAVNGADLASRRYVLPLGEGDFDVLAILRALQDAGYRGPVGLESAGLPGDPRSSLQQSMTAWKEYLDRL